MKRCSLLLLAVLALMPGCDTGVTPTALTQIPAAAIQASSGGIVEAAVESALMRDGTADYLVYFDRRPDLKAAEGMDWSARGRFVMESLQKVAADSQAPAIAVLDANKVKYRAFWIDNVIAVTKSDRGTLNSISTLPGVSRIIAPRKVGIIEPEKREVSVQSGVNAIEANIDHVNAPAAWAMGFDGSGLVVANIDTGVRYTHSVLVDHYRGNNGDGSFNHEYNWYDPYTFSTAPLDGHGHGSHTMGTMVGADGTGTNQTGMAPGARWIACRGCDTSSCTDVNLLACAQWIAAPTDLTGANPNPDARPHIVNNSWGDCSTSYDAWYQGVVDAWHASGVYPVFSNGNASNCGYSEPPGCNTVGNPARYGNVTGVGSTTQSSGQYASHSNWGPTDNPDTVNPVGDPTIKPQVVAPGVNIRSSVATSDTAFESWGGTSMSAPHVTGLISLAWQAAPCLVGNYAATENLIEQTATPIPYVSGCGGEPDYPNNATGWGEINALALVQAAQEACGPSGSLSGTVLDISGNPVAGVVVTAGPRSATSAEDGTYLIPWVPVGVYDVTANSLWYIPATATGVEIIEDAMTVQDFFLSPLSTVRVTGTVRDGSGHGWPLYARINIYPPDGSAAKTIFTDPFNGTWAADVLPGLGFVYEVDPWMDGYQSKVVPFVADTDPDTLDIPVPVATCDMVGYSTTYSVLYTSDFEAHNGGLTLSGTSSFAWGAPTSGPMAAYSGVNVWGTNLAGAYNNGEGGYLSLPALDASAAGDISLSWWHWLQTESGWDYASVQASNDGGMSWNTVWGPSSGGVSIGWNEVRIALGPEYRVSNLMVRFVFTSDSSVTYPGWYIDDVVVQSASCVTTPAGLVGGYAFDGGSGAALVDVVVTGGGYTVNTAPTPDDPAAGDGLWFLTMPTGLVNLTGAKYGYAVANVFPAVLPDTTVRQDIPMVPSTPVTVTGRVVDGNGHGWPLYAYIVLTSVDFGQQILVLSDPFTGKWSAELFQGYEYQADVWAFLPGYDVPNVPFTVGPDPYTLDFALVSSTCTAWGMDPDTCGLIPGGLFGGYTFDGATGEPMNDVLVQSGLSQPWYSMATPWDDAVLDGLYFVFASKNDWPDGNAGITATIDRMTPSDLVAPIAFNDITRLDIGMNEALLKMSPPDMVFEFLPGQSDTKPAELINGGYGYGDFELVERNGGSTTTAAGPNILTLYATIDGSTSGDPLSVAIQNLGYTATSFYNDSSTAFLDALNTGDWDLVIYDGSVWCDPAVFDPLAQYVQNGGKLIFYCWQFYIGYTDAQILADLGVLFNGWSASPLPTYDWDETPLFSFVQDVPDLTDTYNAGLPISGFFAYTTGTGVAAAGTTETPSDGQASIIVGNDGRTIWRGMNDYSNTNDIDLDGQADAMELWMNMVEFLVLDGVTDVPWLSEDPVTGTVEAGTAADLAIRADSTGLPFGTYNARVVVKTPHSRQTPEPMNVTMEIGHLMTVVQAEHGTIAPAGETFVKHNGSVELWFTADDGYHVQDVIVNGVSYGRQDYMLIQNVQEDLLVTAWFEFTCYTHDDCTHANNDCVGYCNVDTCERLKVKPEGWACGDQRDTDCSQPDTCNDAGVCLPNHESSDVMCRESAGVCDAPDYCTGRDAECPVDAKLKVECRASEGICDAADFCNGVDNDCPTDVKEPVSKQCRDLQGVCDVPDFCNGVDNGCPVDVKLPATEICRSAMGECDKIDFCNGVDVFCPADEKLTIECRASVGECDKADFCNGVDNRCPADVKLTTECRAPQGDCDTPESCNGIDNTCPFDQKLPPTKECRASAGFCDAPDFCTGWDDDCPADAKLTIECRASEGVCDIADFCNGVDDACPEDVKSRAECRESVGICDSADYCNGVDDGCPEDGKEPVTTECRMSAGECDAADFCDGINDECPVDEKLTTECRPSEGACDVADFCNGVDDTCPEDVKSRAECRGSAGFCDAADFCNGVEDDCPADVKLTIECRAAAGECDLADFCNGVDDACPADVKLTTECRAAAGECDAADFCNGVDDACPADEKLTTECRASKGDCDVADFCDGVGDTCPEDTRSTDECRPAAGVCDAPEVCTGADDACPADVKLTTECRAVAGACDLAEVCDGIADDCPADVFANGVECDDGNACTYGDYCDGSAATCGAEEYACDLGTCDESVECDGDGGCIPTYKTIGTECDDGIACTTGETCQVGGQCVAETVLTCDEPPHAECVDADTSKVYAPEGICSAETEGCEYESRLFACEDGCDDETGLCGETDVECPDLTVPQCTIAAGYPALDADSEGVACYYKPMPAGTACDDGEECIMNEACDGHGACVGVANPACGVPEPGRDVIDDTGVDEDTTVNQDVTQSDTAGDDLGPHNEGGGGCSSGSGAGTHLGWVLLGLCLASLAIIRRRRAA